MFVGSSWRIGAVALLLVVPLAAATPPFNNLPNAYSTDAQSITDIATDATGQYTSVVVSVDPASQTVPGTTQCVPTIVTTCQNTPGTNTGPHSDIYPCDFAKPVTSDDTPTQGQATCYGIKHDAARRNTALGTAQSTAMLSFFTSANSLTSYYAVGGPSNTVGLWNYDSASHKFEASLPNDQVAYNVSLARVGDAVRVIVGTAATGASLSGHIYIYDVGGQPVWNVNLTDAQGGSVRASALATAPSTGVTVVGVTGGTAPPTGAILFFDPTGGQPVGVVKDVMHAVDTHSAVSTVAISDDGSAVVAGTLNGVWYQPLTGGVPQGETPWNAQLTDGVNAVAITADGSRFAAASGQRIYFYERSTSGTAAQTRFESFDVKEGVADLAYSSDGTLLVAVAGSHVVGFGPYSNQPIWSFDASEATHGGLDTPLRKVTASATGERIVVAGRTHVMAYANVYSATAGFNTPASNIVPGVDLVLPITIQNTGNLPDTYTVRPGQQNSAALQTNLPQRVALNPDGTATVNVTFRAAFGTTPGDLLGDIRVVSENRTRLAALPGRSSLNSEVAAPHVQLSVPRAIALQISSPDQKLLLRQAGEQSVAVTIHNNGNAEGVVNLTTEQLTSRGSSWVIKWTPKETINVPAGETRVANMLVSAPSDAVSGERNFITIHAKEGSLVDSTINLTAYVDAQFRADLTALNNSLDFKPGDVRTLTVNIRNAGNTDDIYNITANVTPPALANDWRVTLSNDQIQVPVGATRPVTLTIHSAVASPRDATILVKAVSQASPNADEGTFRIDLVSKPADQPADNKLIPGVPPLVVAALVGLLAAARRIRGGRP